LRFHSLIEDGKSIPSEPKEEVEVMVVWQ